MINFLTRTRTLVALASLFALSTIAAPIPIVLFERDGWNVQLGGSTELQVIFDSTRSLAESPGNAPIEISSTAAGSHGRTQFSVKNSRLNLALTAPETCGFTGRGYFELDFFGSLAAPGSGNTETGFFTAPGVRLRHAFVQATNGGFQVLVGQTWQLIGWQPNYAMATEQDTPIAGWLNVRSPQIRATYTAQFSNTWALQLALAALRPAQRDGLSPDFQGGSRLVFNGRKSLFTGSSTGPAREQPASLGVSGVVRTIAVPGTTPTSNSTNHVGWAVAANAFVPVFKELSLISEFSYGTGYGDLFSGFTGNISNPSAIANLNLDPGIGALDNNGNFALVNLYSFNVHAQAHLPEWMRTYLNLGIGQLFSDNMVNMNVTPRQPYNRSMAIFTNVVHNFTDQIRAGFEYAYMQTGYPNGNIGYDHRYQLTGHFIF